MICLSLTVIIGSIIGFYYYQHQQKAPICPEGYLTSVSSCEGESDFFSWMNSGKYYYLAKGVPDSKNCKSALSDDLDNAGLPKTNLRLPNLSKWNKSKCKNFRSLNNSTCFSFDMLSGNGNTHYYSVAVFSEDCQNSIYFTSSGRKVEEFIDKFSF